MKWLTAPLILKAVLSWLIPFVFSCCFVEPSGDLAIDIRFFKSLMFATCSVLGAVILRHVLCGLPLREQGHDARLTPTAVRVGVFFLAINALLDVVLLIPFLNASQAKKPDPEILTFSTWFQFIGVGYVAIVAQAWLAGRVADWAVEQRAKQ